jgi:hypothetical protein
VTSQVEIVPLQGSACLVEKWRECVTKADNFRAWMQTPEWLDFHWRPYAKTYLAMLRDGPSGDPIAVTPLVEKACPLQFSIAGRVLAKIPINGVLVIGNVPLFPPSDVSCYLEHAIGRLPLHAGRPKNVSVLVVSGEGTKDISAMAVLYPRAPIVSIFLYRHVNVP